MRNGRALLLLMVVDARLGEEEECGSMRFLELEDVVPCCQLMWMIVRFVVMD